MGGWRRTLPPQASRPATHRVNLALPTARPPLMSDIRSAALACRAATATLAQLDTEARNALLRAMADALDTQADPILAANARDIEAAQAHGTSGALLDRLRLDATGLAGVAAAVREVADMPDPVGQGLGEPAAGGDHFCRQGSPTARHPALPR